MDFFSKKILIDLSVFIFLFFFINYVFYQVFDNLKIKDKLKFLTNINNRELKTIRNVFFIIIVFILYLNNLIFTDIFIKLHTLIEPKTINKIIYSIITIYLSKITIILNELFNNYQKTTFKKSSTLINNYLKILNFGAIITAIILIISFWSEIKPINLITSLSAASAIFVLVFRDFILGVLSSITSANSNIARIGDYIKIEKYNIEGELIDISINSVKLKDSDNNVITFPTYMLTNEVMKNSWFMREIKEKQIKASFYLNNDKLTQLNLIELESLIKNEDFLIKDKDIIFKMDILELNIIKLDIFIYISFSEIKENEENRIKLIQITNEYLNKRSLLL